MAFCRSKPYNEPPQARFQHCAAPVGAECFFWGGCIPTRSRRKLASTVEIFDAYLEVWKQQDTSGISPPGVYSGSCVSLLDLLYSFGGTIEGTGASSYYNSLHTLDSTSYEWNLIQVLNEADGPMRKRGSGMVAYGQDKLALFGGFGIPTGHNQPGATFTKDTNHTDARGWTNELHLFSVNEGMLLLFHSLICSLLLCVFLLDVARVATWIQTSCFLKA